MQPIDPGQYRTKLIYQEQVSIADEYGDAVDVWEDVATVWARLKPLSGREAYFAQQVQAETTHEVLCRYRPGVKPTGRFVVAGTSRNLGILSIADTESMRIELRIMCVERLTPDGTGT